MACKVFFLDILHNSWARIFLNLGMKLNRSLINRSVGMVTALVGLLMKILCNLSDKVGV